MRPTLFNAGMDRPARHWELKPGIYLPDCCYGECGLWGGHDGDCIPYEGHSHVLDSLGLNVPQAARDALAFLHGESARVKLRLWGVGPSIVETRMRDPKAVEASRKRAAADLADFSEALQRWRPRP